MSRRRRVVWLAVTVGAAACVENVTAPGKCPEFCPVSSIHVVDTLLTTSISRDSTFRGYLLAHQASAMALVHAPLARDSRAIMATGAQADRLVLSGDTVSDFIVGSDSLKLTMTISPRDSVARDVTLAFHRLPLDLDSTTTFASLAGAFATSPLRSVNLDTLAAKPGGVDSTTGDAITVDSAGRRTLTVKFTGLQVPYVAADSGKLGIGIRLSADRPTSIAVATRESPFGSARLTWYVQVDSTHEGGTTRIGKTMPPVGIRFDSYVFDPPLAPRDSTLAVGGDSASRSLLRVSLPRLIRDSAQVVRATLLLVPAVAARGAPTDSFVVEAHTVAADFGAKSPIRFDQTGTDTATIRIGASDTVRFEVTNIVQFWMADTLAPTAVMLRSQTEAANPAEIRFYPSAAAAFRPTLRLTYARRFPFGAR